MKLISIIFTVFLALATPLIGGQFPGGFGFIQTNSALVMPPGALDLSWFARGYVYDVEVDGGTAFVSNGTSALASTFGYTRNAELGFSLIIYQDVNYSPVSNAEMTVLTPGNATFRIKFGGYSLGESELTRKLVWGFMPSFHLRIAQEYNIQFEPYYSPAIELNLLGLLSYYEKPLYPDKGLNVHFNLGYTNHNDGMADEQANSQSVSVLLSFIYPREKNFDFGAELYGSFFLSRPTEVVLSREDWLYLCPMIKYSFFSRFNLLLGLDILLIGKKNESNASKAVLNFPNYPTWRINSRISFTPSTAFFTVPKKGGVSEGRAKSANTTNIAESGGSLIDRQAMFKWALEEQGGALEAVDIDLERIRRERKEAEAELEKLKKKLEKKSPKSE